MEEKTLELFSLLSEGGYAKKLMVIGDLEVGGERGRVFHNLGAIGTISATEYKDPEKIVKRWKRENMSI